MEISVTLAKRKVLSSQKYVEAMEKQRELEEGMSSSSEEQIKRHSASSGMELEELMTNRSLLAKMSEDHNDHQNNNKRMRSSINGIDHSKPREVRVEYGKKERKSSHASRSSNSTSATVPLQPTVVIEGYGCKCPVKLKKCAKLLWLLILVIYVCGMPLVLVRIDSKLRATKQRLERVEEQLLAHLHNADRASAQMSKQEKSASKTANEVKYIAEKNYRQFTRFEKNVNRIIADLERKILDNSRRIYYLRSVDALFNSTLPNSTFYIREDCGCPGPSGVNGRPGIRGQNGQQGTPGQAGGQGDQGSRGPSGDTGSRGDPGKGATCICRRALPMTDWLPGEKGQPGVKGKKGDSGTNDGKTGLIPGKQGIPGDRGVAGEPGRRGDTGDQGASGSCIHQDCAGKGNIGGVYTRWGRSECPSKTNATKIYDGYIGGAYHTHEGGGSNYLCLPRKPKYHRYDPRANRGKRGYIHGVEFEVSQNIFDTPSTSGQYHDAMCAVCQTDQRHATIMIPARTTCPDGWTREYFGYLMAQQKFLKRTEYICVDHRPDFKEGTETWGKGAFLHFVETRCGILPCRSDAYKEHWELTCVVCSTS